MILNNKFILSPPQFDDERTVLTARRVVPLTTVNRRLKLRNGLLLLGALTLSGVLGSSVALLTYVERVPRASLDADTDSPALTQVVPEGSRESQIDPQPLPQDVEESGTTDQDSLLAGKLNRPSTRSHKPGSSRSMTAPVTREEATANSLNNSDSLRNHWEERRLRRVMRERRRMTNQGGDLFRIREIFEGTRP